MTYIYSLLSQIPIRKTPDERAEMTSQLLYGEAFQVLHREPKWFFIRSLFDGYEGWIGTLQPGPTAFFSDEPPPLASHFVISQLANIQDDNGNMFRLSFGSEIRTNQYFASNDIQVNPFTQSLTAGEKTALVIHYAQRFLYTPYLWGGRTSMGFDCSGFIQIIHKAAGIALARDAWQQAEAGHTIDFLEEAKGGDLLFFDNEENRITHVGILTENKTVIHASGFVRYDNIDHYGIFNEELKKYTHKLRIIKRLHP